MIDIIVSVRQHVTLIEVRGRVDSMSAAQFREALTNELDSGHKQIVLDLSGVEFMSSAGLREIVDAFKKAKQDTGDVRIAQPSSRVLEVMEMAGLDTVLQIFPTQIEAVRSF